MKESEFERILSKGGDGGKNRIECGCWIIGENHHLPSNTDFILGMGKVADSVEILLDINRVLGGGDLADVA